MAIAGGVETIDCWHPLFGYLGIQGLIRYSIRENRGCGPSGVATVDGFEAGSLARLASVFTTSS
jgi:hypothetical protein